MRLEIRHDHGILADRLKHAAVLLDGNLQPLMAGIGGILQASTHERVRIGKAAPDGTPWEQWSERTRRAHTGKTGKIHGSLLVDMGEKGGLLGELIYREDADSVLVGTPLFYGKYLQQGTPNMPARPFLGLSAQDYRDIDDLLSDFLNGLIAAD